MNKKYDLIVYIGRFQPVHNAHVETLRRAGNMARKVIAIVGSSDRPRTFKNPWTSTERSAMLMNVMIRLKEETGAEFIIEKNIDTIYNDQAWAVRVQGLVSKHQDTFDRVGIIGHYKDESSFYLKMFPQWEAITQELIEPLNATQIRDLYFSKQRNMNWFNGVLPPETMKYLTWFSTKPEYEQIIKEKEFIDNYKKQFDVLPYPPIFVTVDAVVMQAGHVLMVRRRSEPGKGLLALPGGFVNAKTDKNVQSAMIRELIEETKIKLQERVLIRNIRKSKVFDAIDRSERGRTITHAFNIVLDSDTGELPKVKGSDDAEKAMWIPIADVRSDNCFEDHYDILQYFLGNE